MQTEPEEDIRLIEFEKYKAKQKTKVKDLKTQKLNLNQRFNKLETEFLQLTKKYTLLNEEYRQANFRNKDLDFKITQLTG